MNGKRRNDKMCMSITEQLGSVKEYCCSKLCKYREALENGSLILKETTNVEEYLEEVYCKKCKVMEL